MHKNTWWHSYSLTDQEFLSYSLDVVNSCSIQSKTKFQEERGVVGLVLRLVRPPKLRMMSSSSRAPQERKNCAAFVSSELFDRLFI